jgi:NTP pyrophosphatase (non-canonical NTP hydrolase)
MDVKEIQTKLSQFAEERDWDQFHSPKNLAMALSVECSELLEILQWLTQEQSENLPQEKLIQVEEEIGDIAIYLLRIADKLGIDLAAAVESKFKKNADKYPADRVRGQSKKYDEY